MSQRHHDNALDTDERRQSRDTIKMSQHIILWACIKVHKKIYNSIVSDYDIDLKKIKKNYNAAVSDCDIANVYADVARTHWFDQYFDFRLIFLIFFLNNVYLPKNPIFL